MGNKDNSIILYAVGDIAASHKDPELAFKFVGPILREGDIVFAQNERHYSERTDVSPRGGFTELTTIKHAEALKLGGFHVISFASNHSMDLGPRYMLETVDALKNLGFAVVGAGKNLNEARKPVIINRKETKVAFLAYASVLRTGYDAGPERAGVAPMRAYTLYHQLDYQPGTPPQILTFPYKDDLEAIIDDVKTAKSQADIVAVSFHWGIHHVHAAIARYQKEVAHAVIDAGADIILGHHPHILKGVEVYSGKPIFYSMGNFAFDLDYVLVNDWRKQSPDFNVMLDHYGWKLDAEWRTYPFPPESRKSMIVKCRILDKKIQKISFLPVLINKKAQPRIVRRGNKNFDGIIQYMNDISENQGLKTKYLVEGNEVVVST